MEGGGSGAGMLKSGGGMFSRKMDREYARSEGVGLDKIETK